MFEEFGCTLEKKVLDKFIFIVTNENIIIGSEVLKFDLIEIYKHIINCDIHNRFFVNYINNFAKINRNPHIITENIKYITRFIQEDGISQAN